MIILGIDPGLANTGWGVVEHGGTGFGCRAYGCITTGASDALPDRLAAVHSGLLDVVARYRPQACAIESVYFGTNAKSAFATGQARGAAILALSGAAVEFAEYSPPQIKRAVCGSGTADKQQIQYMVRVLLGLDHTPHPDHAADALAVAMCHANLRDRARLESGVRR